MFGTGCFLDRAATVTRHHSPNHQYDDCSHDRTDEPRALAGAIPADRLAQIGGAKCSDYAEDRRKDEAGGLVSPAVMNFAITPAMNPMIIVQMMPIADL